MTQIDTTNWKDLVPVETRSIRRSGLLCIGGFVAAFGAWSALFPLSSAVIAPGMIISAGQNKLIQHQFGGPVSVIHANDGQSVKQGDVIVTLDPIVDLAELDRLRARRALLLATESRLTTQISGGKTIDFPVEISNRSQTGMRGSYNVRNMNDTLYGQLIADQTAVMEAANRSLNEEILGLRHQISALKRQNSGRKSRNVSLKQQLDILQEQYSRMAPMVRVGYVARNRVDELNGDIRELEGTIANLTAEIASALHRIAETKTQVSKLISSTRERLTAELLEDRGQIAELTSQIMAAGSNVDHREIRAPVDGVIVKSAFHTIGGVVRPGDVIAEIVPKSSQRLIEARIMPQDIDYVRKNQAAEVVISAFNARLYDPIKASVDYVAADTTTDPNSGETYFVVRLKMNEASSKFNRIGDLRVGMSGEIFIQTGDRTFLNYLVKPIADSFQRAFQER